MFKRIWGYIKQLFRTTAERAMDPEIEIEQAITEARKRDQDLRNQAAKVIAHRTQIEQKLENAAKQVGEARETAKQALLRAEKAKNEGNVSDLEKWTQAAQSLALKLQASESNLAGLKEQYEIAIDQADAAKNAVQQNAMRLQELAAKRMQLVGQLQQAKMQEAVNSAVESMEASLEMEAPSLEKVEEKIQTRLAEAKARTELREATPEGAEAELREAISLAQADSKLEELKRELGLAVDGGDGGGLTETTPG
jgi:phage shock protein A